MTKEPGDAHLAFPAWNLDVFSPDGAYVLLLQDEYGPYHIIATSRLKQYLNGTAKPDYVVPDTAPGSEPHTYSNGHWLSTHSIEFTESCCGSSEKQTYTLPAK